MAASRVNPGYLRPFQNQCSTDQLIQWTRWYVRYPLHTYNQMYRDPAPNLQNTNSRYQNIPTASNFYQSSHQPKHHPAEPPIQISPPTYNPARIDYSTPDRDRGVTYMGESRRRSPGWNCTWVFVIVLVLGIIGGAIYYLWRNSSGRRVNPIIDSPAFSKGGITICNNGFFEDKGRCLACPMGSQWNGSNCQYPKNYQPPQERFEFTPQDLATYIRWLYRGEETPHPAGSHSKNYQHLRF